MPATPTRTTPTPRRAAAAALARCLDPVDAETFFSEHWERRPLVVPRGPDVVITNLTTGLETSVLVDGQQIATLGSGEQAVVRVGAQPSLLATLPEVTFFSRYAANFGG